MQRLQSPILPLQLEESIGAIDGKGPQFGLEWLGKEIVGAERDRPQGVRLIVLSGENNHLHVRGKIQQLLQQREALGYRIGVRRLAEIHGDHGRLVAPELHQRTFAIGGRQTLEAVKRPLDLLLEGWVVLEPWALDEARRFLPTAPVALDARVGGRRMLLLGPIAPP